LFLRGLPFAVIRLGRVRFMLSLPYHAIMSLSAVVSGSLAIVLFTVAVRAALLPLAIRAARGERARAALSPAELSTLGPGLYAGLLPALAQIPFFMIMYRLFTSSTVDGAPNGLLSQSLLGVHLGTRFLTDPGALVFWLVFLLLAAIAWYAGRRVRGFVRVLPFVTVLVAAYVPLAAGIYLVTSTMWTAVERTLLATTGG
jgi:YidC/Oxa1 family membrane protein insertase